jgi:LysR family glycine cleavage system transcriptional activator
MRKRLPPLNWLRAFEASARQLSFTHAAAELNLTQAAVSQQVKGLESQLGTALFKRLPRGLELTEAGLAYLPVVHEAVERLAAATDEIFGEGHVRLLTIRVSLVFFTHWLALRLPDFRERHPEVNLRITSNIWGGDSSVTDVEADMEIRHGHGNWAGLKAERLTWDTLLPVCAPHLPSAQAPLSSPKDLAHHELLHVLGYEEGWGYWLKKAGAARVDSSKGMQFDTLISALKAAELGQGVALARSSLVAGRWSLVAGREHARVGATHRAIEITAPDERSLLPCLFPTQLRQPACRRLRRVAAREGPRSPLRLPCAPPPSVVVVAHEACNSGVPPCTLLALRRRTDSVRPSLPGFPSTHKKNQPIVVFFIALPASGSGRQLPPDSPLLNARSTYTPGGE